MMAAGENGKRKGLLLSFGRTLMPLIGFMVVAGCFTHVDRIGHQHANLDPAPDAGQSRATNKGGPSRLQRSPSPPQPKAVLDTPEESPAPQPPLGAKGRAGRFEANRYINDVLGFAIDLPRGWTLPDEETQRMVYEAFGPLVLHETDPQEVTSSSTVERLELFMCASGEVGGASIALHVTPIAQESPVDIPDILGWIAANASETFRNVTSVGPIQSLKIGGGQWFRLTLSMKPLNMPMQQLIHMKKMRGWILMLACTSGSLEERATIQRSLDSVRCGFDLEPGSKPR